VDFFAEEYTECFVQEFYYSHSEQTEGLSAGSILPFMGLLFAVLFWDTELLDSMINY